jgi:hypothetical protein
MNGKNQDYNTDKRSHDGIHLSDQRIDSLSNQIAGSSIKKQPWKMVGRQYK